MAIKKNILVFGLLIIALGPDCKKQSLSCPKFGYEYTYMKPGVIYSPAIDSILLGTEIILEASAPKSFYEEEKGYTVKLEENTILGPLNVSKATNDTIIPILGAIENVTLTQIIGTIVKDSIHFSEGQLKSFRTVYWDGVSSDSFRIKLSIKPLIRGTYFVGLAQQSNRDKDCALFKYFLKVINPDQHLYLLANASNGYIGDYSRNFVYCFKVY